MKGESLSARAIQTEKTSPQRLTAASEKGAAVNLTGGGGMSSSCTGHRIKTLKSFNFELYANPKRQTVDAL